jgi:chromosome segregation ATPase
MPNLTSIPGKTDEFKAAIEHLKRQMDSAIEYATLKAHLQRAAYNAYMKEGFTPAEALELCKTFP